MSCWRPSSRAPLRLRGPEPNDLLRQSAAEAQRLRTHTLSTLAWAYHLRGDRQEAVATIQQALAMIEIWNRDSTEGEYEFADQQNQTLTDLRERLAAYQHADGPRTK